MTTLVVIITHQGAQDLLNRHWPWYVRSGCPLVVVEHADKPPMELPERFVNGWAVNKLRVGTDPTKQPFGYVGRFVEVLQFCVNSFNAPTDYFFIEADAIFTRKVPPHPGGLVTTLAGHKSPGFRGANFYHTPWWMDRKTMGDILLWGRRMLDADLDEAGLIDRWLGLMELLYDLTIVPASSYSKNNVEEIPIYLKQARAAALDGVTYYIHGVKTQQQLEYITKGL